MTLWIGYSASGMGADWVWNGWIMNVEDLHFHQHFCPHVRQALHAGSVCVPFGVWDWGIVSMPTEQQCQMGLEILGGRVGFYVYTV